MQAGTTSLPSRGAWIEIPTVNHADVVNWLSLPSRGAWIEIGNEFIGVAGREIVAPLTGSVDRNSPVITMRWSVRVAPFTGSVDRN